MPIYAYRCSTCGRAKDVLQKMSDPVLTDCPFCGAGTFVKQVTAAGFQLKGSGWYVTDFRGDSKAPKATESGESPAAPKADGAAAGAAPAPKGDAAAPATASAPAAAPAPAATPSAPSSGGAATGSK